MYKKKCDGCGEKDVFVYAKDRLGTLPVAYCSEVCKKNAKYEKRFDTRFKKS
jgi:hypothetical protein